ncbi:MAG: hypothetical protein LWW97_03410 [Deltaproteobacteria bacterium]|nr:hypothetical protein [Deltaproteobacteria bacterium]
MAWRLLIEHIDVAQGDATFILAEEYDPNPNSNTFAIQQQRSALIDGGGFSLSNDIHHRINTVWGVNQLNVMAVTHYDADHFNGIRALLNIKTTTVYDNTLIFDQGEQGIIEVWKTGGTRLRPLQIWSTFSNRESNYIAYLNAINSRGNGRQRVTEKVVSDCDLPHTGDLGADGWLHSDCLVGQEILWYGTGAVLSDGAPKITCIAANQHVLQAGGKKAHLPTGMGVDQRNEKSLAFLIQFNNFKYYVGGDIESNQEDGNDKNNGIMHFLNPDNNSAAGRVLAMKISHHGSNRSTSADFVNRLRPSAAFISCGINNSFGHPDQKVLDNLQRCESLQNYYLTEDRNYDDCIKRSGQDGVEPNIERAYSAKATVAGAWGNPNDIAPQLTEGHIRLIVSQEQSLNQVVGGLGLGGSRFSVSCYTADMRTANNLTRNHL